MIQFHYRLTITLALTLLTIGGISSQDLHHRNQDLPCIHKNYNVAFHIAVDSINREPLYSRNEIDSITVILSNFFSPICVSFSVCEYNVLEDDYSLGRVRDQPLTKEQQFEELKVRFSRRRRINVFMLEYIDLEDCGTSTFEGILTEKDAIVYTEKSCIDDIAGQIAHHLGHTFGLSDTYDAFSIELVDGSNCETTADRLCDTPADPYLQTFISPEDRLLLDQKLISDTYFNAACEFLNEIRDPNGEYYQPDMGNIMSAYPCKCGFTNSQYELMAETILRSNINHF